MTTCLILSSALCIGFAATLSSPQLGTFFDVPEWIPQHVGPDRTPGSESATNATRRIDATALAAVNACFEAWYERLYCFNEGNSNVWDEAEYGPTEPGPNFRFDLPPVIGVSVPRLGIYRPYTNRVANMGTRRFVEYSNLTNLVFAICDWEGDGVTWTAGAFENVLNMPRPSWSDTFKPAQSTTIFDTFAGHESVRIPQIDWCGGRDFMSSLTCDEWSRVAMTWDVVRPEMDVTHFPRRPVEDPWLNWDFHVISDAKFLQQDRYVSINFLPTFMMERVHFDEELFWSKEWLGLDVAESNPLMPSDPGYRELEAYRASWFITNSYACVVGKGREAADGGRTNRIVGVEGITNETRRLVTDSIAGLGLALGALDRTYYRLDPAYCTAVTNFQYENSISLETDPKEVAVTWDSTGNGHVDTADRIPLGELHADGAPVMITNSYGSVTDLPYVKGMTMKSWGAQPGCRVDGDVGGGYALRFDDDGDFYDFVLREVRARGYDLEMGVIYPIDLVGDVMTQGVRPDGSFATHFEYGLSIGVYDTETWERTDVPFSVSGDLVLSNRISMIGTCGYSRGYGHWRSVRPRARFVDGRPTHPGPLGFGRCKSADCWSFLGAGIGRGTKDEPITDFYDYYITYDATNLYKSVISPYASAGDCRNVIDSHFVMMREKVDAMLGLPNIDDPLAMIPVSADDLAQMSLVATEDTVLSQHWTFLKDHRYSYYNSGSRTYVTNGVLLGFYLTPSMDGGGFTFRVKDDTYQYEAVISPQWPLTVASMTLTADGTEWLDPDAKPAIDEFWGVAAAGKMESWSKVDWNWNALRRDNGNSERSKQ